MASLSPLLYLLSLSLPVIGMILYIRGTFRFVYLVSKIRGPSLWELVTVHAKPLMTQMLTHLCKQCEHHAYEPWGFWTMTGDYIVVISNLATVSEMYQSKDLTLKPDLFYSSVADYIGEGSIALRGGEKWRLHRKVISPAFHKSILESNIDIISNGAQNILKEFKKFADGPSFDITKIIDYELVDRIVRFLSSDRILFSDIPRLAESISQSLVLMHLKSMSPIQHWFQLRFHKPTREIESKVRTTLTECKTLIDRTCHKVATEMKNGADHKPRDVLECSLESLAKRGTGMSKKEILDEAVTVTGAGAETTKTAVKIAILLLALHQEVQQRVFTELEDIFGSSDQPPTPQDLDRMEYLGMIIKETLRLFPPAPLIARKAMEETNLNGTIIPKGAIVVLNIMTLHRNPNNFKDPLKFIPERFLPELSQNRNPFSYLPFSSGMRNCVGKSQVNLVMKTVLSSILRRYKILPGEGMNSMDDIKFVFNISLNISKSVVKLVSRE